jgi:PEP-CTERM motif
LDFFGGNDMKNIALALVAAGSVLIAAPANAAYLINVEQVGSDVVATGSGSIDFADLTFQGFEIPAAPDVDASDGRLAVASTSEDGDYYTGVSGPTQFGSGGLFVADSGSGSEVGSVSATEIVIPPGYGAGDPIGVSTATWNNQTIGSLGLTPGTYVWTWGTGGDADSLTIDIQGSVPEPTTWAMLILGMGAMGAMLRRRKGALAGA